MPRLHAPDGRGLFYDDSGGDGPAVLCLPGLSRNGRDFDGLADRLAPGFRVLRLDARGRGGSDWAADPAAEYVVPVEAADALALLDHLGLTGVGVVGTSRGGMLAMAMTAMRPGALAAVVLNDIGPVVQGAGLMRIFAALGAPPVRPATHAAIAAALREANEAQFPGVPMARWEEHARATYVTDAEGALIPAFDPALPAATAAGAQPAQGGVIADIDLWPVFAALDPLPVLAIRGANSDILSPSTLAEMAARHPRLATLTVADRGHAPFLDEPEALDAIDAFLNRSLRP